MDQYKSLRLIYELENDSNKEKEYMEKYGEYFLKIKDYNNNYDYNYVLCAEYSYEYGSIRSLSEKQGTSESIRCESHSLKEYFDKNCLIGINKKRLKVFKQLIKNTVGESYDKKNIKILEYTYFVY